MTHILVVDDNANNVYLLRVLLEGDGFRVSTAANGRDALVTARHDRPDLIVSDLLMPVLDGYSLLREVRHDPQLALVPFVVYTATYTDAEDEQLALSLGATAFLVKPSEPEVLLRHVRAALQVTVTLPAGAPGRDGELETLREYSQALVRKLERKLVQLEQANREIARESNERRLLASTRAAILDALPAHIALLDGTGTVVAVNEAWRRFASANGFSSPDFGVGQNYLGVCERAEGECAEESRAVAAGIRAVLDGRTEEFVLEYPCHAPNLPRWYRVMITAVGSHGGSGAVVMHVDVTERRVAVDALRASEDRYRDLVESSHDLVWVVDAAGCLTYVNSAARRIYGRELSELIGRPFQDFAPAEQQAKDVASLMRALETGQDSLNHESRVLRPDGSLVIVRANARVMRDALGRVTGLSGVSRDITDEKLSADRLSQQAALLDLARDAIAVRDPAHCVVYWNDSAARLYGWSAAEAHGRHVADLLCIDPARFAEASAALLDAGEWRGELQKTTRTGAVRTVECSWTLVRADDGAPQSILTIDTDVTERRSLERQFLRAQRLESLGTLAGGIAHDLNNVLAPILMSIGMLRDGETDPGKVDLLDTIEGSAFRGVDMIRQVLGFARGIDGERVDVQVDDLLRAMGKIADETFLKSIEVEVHVPDDLWLVKGDRTQLHQVLLNLCVNARDAMPSGGRLRLSAENMRLDEHDAGFDAEATPGEYVVMTVEDTGTGIPRDVLERIFEPFFTTKAPGMGTGLGLSTTRAIVKGHGGFVRVYTESGRGTRFRVYLPAQREASDVAAAVVPQEAVPRGQGELIMVIDDEQSVREVTSRTLTAFGYRVLDASDGADAVARFAASREPVAAVITDMMMPIMDGVDTVRVLRHLAPDLRVLVISGLITEARMADVAALGISHVLAKPFTAQALLRALHATLHDAAV